METLRIFLAVVGVMALSQGAWFGFMYHVATTLPDPTGAGAVVALWMLGIPVVALIAGVVAWAILPAKEAE